MLRHLEYGMKPISLGSTTGEAVCQTRQVFIRELRANWLDHILHVYIPFALMEYLRHQSLGGIGGADPM